MISIHFDKGNIADCMVLIDFFSIIIDVKEHKRKLDLRITINLILKYDNFTFKNQLKTGSK